MKEMRIHLLAMAVLCMTITACFKDEPLNAECDIERAWIHYDNPEKCTWNLSDTIVSNVYSTDNTIMFRVKPGTDRTRLAPQFITTPGATLKPESGTVMDFSTEPVVYTVTSQDGNWHREYKVAFVEEHHTTRDTIYYDFERFALENNK